MPELQADIQVYKVEQEGDDTLLGEFKGAIAEAIDFVVEIPQVKTTIPSSRTLSFRKSIADFISGSETTYNVKNSQGVNVIRLVKGGPASAPSAAKAPPEGKSKNTANGGKKKKSRKHTQRRKRNGSSKIRRHKTRSVF
jgi:hypothetical protein